MKFIDEFRNKELAQILVSQINSISRKEIALMEVCGGHTMALYRFGIPYLLPDNIKLLSGPGCPVCVTGRGYIDKAIAYSRLDDVIITTFGDLIKVPGSTSSLNKERAEGNDIRIVYSVLDSLQIAADNPGKKVIFLGVGFETTAPGSAVAIFNAYNNKLDNFYFYSSHKVMPPAMAALIDEGVKINGYIAPGHVSVITGTDIYLSLPQKYGLGCVVTGFEPIDILQSIYMLIKQFENNAPAVEIQYNRAVKPEGNLIAKKIMNEVFELQDDWWRGFGILKDSGLKIKEKYSVFDAEKMIKVEVEELKEEKGCICGEILKGLKTPKDCKLFNTACNPENPIGACMVSNEGACAAFYRYNRYE
ncbi:MAG: hydrogenase formation protein HypD [Bacteroidota bacterium]